MKTRKLVNEKAIIHQYVKLGLNADNIASLNQISHRRVKAVLDAAGVERAIKGRPVTNICREN